MTISSTASQELFLGNGVTTAFSFSFVPDAATDLYVLYTDANGNITTLANTAYTISINAPATGSLWGVGGTLNYPLIGSPIANGTSLTLVRAIPLLQTTSLTNQGNQWPNAVEEALDTLTMQVQQVAARTGQFRGTWQTGLVYQLGDIVIDGVNGADTTNYYVCAIANTSGTWSTDLANGDWNLMINIQAINTDVTNAAASATAAAASAVSASNFATVATNEASTATTEAGIATTEAGIATTQATNAASSATSASTSASNASTSATSAATQATNASTSATNAATSATSAATQATNAANSATTASTYATNSANSATSAAASAVLAGSTLTATSTTSNTIGTGSFTFTTQANKNFFANQNIVAGSAGTPSAFIHGIVASYSGTALVITETDNGGSGTHADWNISVSGTQGTAGAGSGSVTSVTFTGDGTILSSTPSSAVTTSGTLNATALNAPANSVLGNASASPSAPSYLTSIALSGSVSGNTIISTVTTGTAPITVTSTTPVTNLTIPGTQLSGTSLASAITASSLVAFGATATVAKANAINSATTAVNTSSATAPSPGQVLTATSSTAATWQAPSGGAMVLLSTQTINTSTASISDTTHITSSYTHYVWEISNLESVTGGVDGYITFQVGGSFIGSAEYSYNGIYMVDTASTVHGFNGNGTAQVNTTGAQSAIENNSPFVLRFEFWQPSVSANMVFVWEFAGGGNWMKGGGQFQDDPVTGIKLTMSSGNIAQCTANLYGIT